MVTKRDYISAAKIASIRGEYLEASQLYRNARENAKAELMAVKEAEKLIESGKFDKAAYISNMNLRSKRLLVKIGKKMEDKDPKSAIKLYAAANSTNDLIKAGDNYLKKSDDYSKQVERDHSFYEEHLGGFVPSYMAAGTRGRQQLSEVYLNHALNAYKEGRAEAKIEEMHNKHPEIKKAKTIDNIVTAILAFGGIGLLFSFFSKNQVANLKV